MRRKDLFSLGNTPAERSASKLLFLIGLGAMTQINIGGYTAISEFFLVLLSPIILLRNLRFFAKDKCLLMLSLLVFWFFGQAATDLYLDNPIPFMIRGLIPALGIFVAVLAIYPMLRRHPMSFKFFLLGAAISGVVSIFIFQPGTAAGSASVVSGQQSAAEAVIGYKLFWVSKLNDWIGLPIKGWYLTVPLSYSVCGAFVLSLFALYSGGRSSFLIAATSGVMIMLGKKSHKTLAWVKKHMIIVSCCLFALGFAGKAVYSFAASHNLMGEVELEKYEKQAKGKSALDTLMAGRTDFFIALLAIKDHPFRGHGSYAFDHHGYILDFVSQHGTPNDVQGMMRLRESLGVGTIPAHSHILTYWLWGGILGLLPWIYITYLLLVTLFRRLDVYPPYFGLFAMVIPNLIWAVFFSPLGNRIFMGFMISSCLVVRAMKREKRRSGEVIKTW